MTRTIRERVTPVASTREVTDGTAVTRVETPTPSHIRRALEGLGGLVADPGLWRGDDYAGRTR